MPPMDSPIAPNPGRSLYGPLCPNPEMRTMTSPGLSRLSVSYPRPNCSSVRGRKFSTTMSAFAARARTTAWPSASRRFTATDFLLRACAYHQSELPSWSLRHFLRGSPSPGASTLMTSAPNSARRRAQYGPAIRVPSSTTLRLERGASIAGWIIRQPRRLPAHVEGEGLFHVSPPRPAPHGLPDIGFGRLPIPILAHLQQQSRAIVLPIRRTRPWHDVGVVLDHRAFRLSDARRHDAARARRQVLPELGEERAVALCIVKPRQPQGVREAPHAGDGPHPDREARRGKAAAKDHEGSEARAQRERGGDGHDRDGHREFRGEVARKR